MKNSTRSFLLAIVCTTVLQTCSRPGKLTPSVSTTNHTCPLNQPPQTEAAAQSAPDPVAEFNWRQIESTNYHTFIANLRHISCPESTIRDIVIADLNQLFDLRIATHPHNRKEILATESAVVRTLLGIDYSRGNQSSEVVTSEARFWSISPTLEAQAGLIDECLRHFEELRSSIIGEHGTDTSPLTEEQTAQLQLIDIKEQDYLDTILSPEERVEFDLHNTGLGDEAKRFAELFELGEYSTKEVFLGLRQLETLSNAGPNGSETSSTLDQTIANLRETFGPDVAASLTVCREPGFMEFASSIKAQQLPIGQIVPLWQRLPKETSTSVPRQTL